MSGTKRIAMALAMMGGLSCIAGDALAYAWLKGVRLHRAPD